MTAPTERTGTTDSEVLHNDLVDLLIALGLGTHARPYSAHEVMQREIIPATRAAAAASRGEAQRTAVLIPFEALFSGGPDTVCRTTYPDGAEHVEVPIAELRGAFAEAHRIAGVS